MAAAPYARMVMQATPEAPMAPYQGTMQAGMIATQGGPSDMNASMPPVAAQHKLPPNSNPTPLQAMETMTIPDGLHPFDPLGDGSEWTAQALGVPGVLHVQPGAQAGRMPMDVLAGMNFTEDYEYMNMGQQNDSNFDSVQYVPQTPFFGKYHTGEPLFARSGYGGTQVGQKTLEIIINLQAVNYFLAVASRTEFEEQRKQEKSASAMDIEWVDKDLYGEFNFMGFMDSSTTDEVSYQSLSIFAEGVVHDVLNVWSNEMVKQYDYLGFLGTFVSRDQIKGGAFVINAESEIRMNVPELPEKIFQMRPFKSSLSAPDLTLFRQTDNMGNERAVTWVPVGQSLQHREMTFNGMDDVFFDARKKLSAQKIKVDCGITIRVVRL